MSDFSTCEYCNELGVRLCNCSSLPRFCCDQHILNHMNSTRGVDHHFQDTLIEISKTDIDLLAQAAQEYRTESIRKVISEKNKIVASLQNEIRKAEQECLCFIKVMLNGKIRHTMDQLISKRSLPLFSSSPFVQSLASLKKSNNFSLTEILNQLKSDSSSNFSSLSLSTSSLTPRLISKSKDCSLDLASSTDKSSSQQLPELDLQVTAVISIQCLLRGFLWRTYKCIPSSEVKRMVKQNKLVQELEAKLGEFKTDWVFDDPLPRKKKPKIELNGKAIYEGEWNDKNQKHGFGTEIYNSGAKYVGYWKFNRKNGKGRNIDSDGSVYEGDWKNGKANGQGKFIQINGAVYIGYWKDDVQHGKGKETHTDGYSYEGDYFNGKMHGFGKFRWTDGSTYEGKVFNSNIHGYGVYIWSDGRKYEGEFNNNKMEGEGISTWSDGRVYRGQYLNDHKHGFGIFRWPGGGKYEGNWEYGKQHGKGYYYTKNGRKKEGEWVAGKRVRWIT